jgi:flagellar biosynthesis/type III secretory pathway protein FliH
MEGWKEGRKEGRKGGREEGRKGGREEGRKGGREGGRVLSGLAEVQSSVSSTHIRCLSTACNSSS